MRTDYRNAPINQTELHRLINNLKPIKESLNNAINDAAYTTQSAFMHAPVDTQTINTIKALVDEKKNLDPALILLIGIGGSNLGTLAVFQALYGTLYNDTHPQKRFYCADTLDELKLKSMLALAEGVLKAGKNVLLIIVSKSGKTLETLVNASFFIDLLKRFKQDYAQFITIITDEHSDLWHYAQQHTISTLSIPHKIGGRYSVFTAAGLFPLALMDVDIDALCAGAQKTLLEEATLSAAIIYDYWCRGVVIHDLFVSSPRFEHLGAWYRQLMAESLGKQDDLAGKRIEVGITPTVSIGTIDLHSVGQLYLSGPRNRLTTFLFDTDQSTQQYVCPTIPLVPAYAAHKSIADIQAAIWAGITHAYQQEQRPFLTMHISNLNPTSLGAFLYLKMIETVYLGSLFNINPFDQPQVELYKRETERVLSHG